MTRLTRERRWNGRFGRWAGVAVVLCAAIAVAATLSGSAGADPPIKLVISSSPVTVTAGADSGTITVQVQDDTGTPVNPASDIQVDLSSNSGGTVTFKQGVNAVTSVTITTADTQADFTYNDTQAGTPTITVTDHDGNLTQGMQQETVNPGLIDHFVVGDPGGQTVNTPFQVSIDAKDANGNVPTAWAGQTQCVQLSGASNAPDGTPPDYGSHGGCASGQSELTFDGNGHADANVKLFNATSTDLTVTDANSAANGHTGSFNVDPGPLASFDWTTNPSQASYAAGATINATVKAYDQWQNLKTNYSAPANAFSGLHPSPSGCASDHSTVTSGGTFSCNPVYPTFSGGIASGGFVDYSTETSNTSLSITDGAHSATSTSQFTVTPAGLASFKWTVNPTNNGSYTAGTAITATVDALDPYGNVETDYNGAPGAPGFSGLHQSPAGCDTDNTTVIPHGTNGCNPVYPNFVSGVASGGFVDYRTEPSAVTLSVTDGSATGTSTTSFTVTAAALDKFTWTTNPANASYQAGAAITAVVKAYDVYGNLKTNYSAPANAFSGLHQSPTGCASDHSTVTSGGTFGCDPVYPAFNLGVASGGFVDYRTETSNTSLSITDGAVSATSTSLFTVTPAALGSFSWTVNPTNNGSYTAGTAITATVDALDTYGNLKTDYNGAPGAPGFSGLHPSPAGCDTDNTTVISHGTHACNPVYPNFASGVASGGFVDYRTEPSAVTLSVTDGTATGTSTTSFTVAAAALDKFTWTTNPANASYTAGTPIAATVNAYDIYGNLKTNYTAPANAFSGLHQSPTGCASDHTTVTSGGTFGCNPVYPAFNLGVASGGFVDYRTETSNTSLSITDGAVTATSTSLFTVTPAALGSFTWTTNPASASYQAGTAIAAVVKAYDLFGNLKTDYSAPANAFSGLHQSPSGCAADHTTVTSGGAFGCNPVYPTFNLGVASGGFIDYRTETSNTALSITDGAVGPVSSSQFMVTPAALGSFVWSTNPGAGPFVAGNAFAAAVTAYDVYGNLKTNYSAPANAFSGLHASPSGCASNHTTVTSGGAFGCNPVYPTFSQGVATGGFVDYSTEASATSLAIADGAVHATSSTPFTVTPADPQSVSFSCVTLCRQPFETQVNTVIDAGLNPPGVRAQVIDIYGNLGFGESVVASIDTQFITMTGNPTGGTFKLTFGANQTAAIPYNATAQQVQNALNGLASITSAGGVVVTDGPLPGLAIHVNFNTPAPNGRPLMTAQSSLTGGTSPTVTVSQAVFTNASTTTVTTDANGVAIFNNLTIASVASGYRIVATASRVPNGNPKVAQSSAPFIVAQTVNTCITQGSCSGLAQIVNNSTVNVNATGTNAGNTLGIALLGAALPAGVCPGFTVTPGIPWTFVDVNPASSGGPTPTLTVTWTLSKVLVNQLPDNGAAHYNLCLGSVNLQDPQGTHTTGFKTKSGAAAIPKPDATFGVTVFWGELGDCNKVPAKTPCVSSRGKDSAGNLIFVFSIPYPWDPHGPLGT